MGLSQRFSSEQDADVIAEQLVHIILKWFEMHPTATAIQFDIAEPRRTDAQNDFMWPLVREIGRHVGEDSERCMLNDLLVEKYGARYKTVRGREQQIFPKTSAFKKAQMSEFLDWMIRFASTELGIRLQAPPGYEEWAK